MHYHRVSEKLTRKYTTVLSTARAQYSSCHMHGLHVITQVLIINLLYQHMAF